MILAPAAMAAETEPKKSAARCFEEIGLDPDSYRIGHTKASWRTLDRELIWRFRPVVLRLESFFYETVFTPRTVKIWDRSFGVDGPENIVEIIGIFIVQWITLIKL